MKTREYPNISEQITKRFQELEEQGSKVPMEKGAMGGMVAKPKEFHQWVTSAMHLIRTVFGEKSPYFENLSKLYAGSYALHDYSFAGMTGCHRTLKSGHEGTLENRPLG